MRIVRCSWCENSDKMRYYHDNEWGTPSHNDKDLYEFLFLEAMQCGLSWNLMIEKREIFRACFADFDYNKVAAFDDADVQRIMEYPGMIKSRPKIRAMINNAQRFVDVIAEFGNFDNYLWGFCGGKTILYKGHQMGYMPAKNALSEKLAKDLKKRGFKYMGPVTTYSYLQAAGIINDHIEECYKYNELRQKFSFIEIEE